jgi:hypothetical protein
MLHGMAEHGENIAATSAIACHLQKNPVGNGWRNNFNICQGFKPQRLFALAYKRQRRHSVFTNGSMAYKDNIKI